MILNFVPTIATVVQGLALLAVTTVTGLVPTTPKAPVTIIEQPTDQGPSAGGGPGPGAGASNPSGEGEGGP